MTTSKDISGKQYSSITIIFNEKAILNEKVKINGLTEKVNKSIDVSANAEFTFTDAFFSVDENGGYSIIQPGKAEYNIDPEYTFNTEVNLEL